LGRDGDLLDELGNVLVPGFAELGEDALVQAIPAALMASDKFVEGTVPLGTVLVSVPFSVVPSLAYGIGRAVGEYVGGPIILGVYKWDKGLDLDPYDIRLVHGDGLYEEGLFCGEGEAGIGDYATSRQSLGT
ncbi:hypothetical protein, partial [Shimia sp.]|uniref:hypothetical protein n=1 Tax=Shimia sp. TaxID=1954381 RepID=UPI003299C3C8